MTISLSLDSTNLLANNPPPRLFKKKPKYIIKDFFDR